MRVEGPNRTFVFKLLPLRSQASQALSRALRVHTIKYAPLCREKVIKGSLAA